jgi:hypothetical protein
MADQPDSLESIKGILSNITSPGDFGTALLGGALGLAADIFLLHFGVPPGYMTVLGVTTLFGLKKSGDGAANALLNRKRAQQYLIRQAAGFEKVLSEEADPPNEIVRENCNQLIHRLATYRTLWKAGAMSDEDFGKELNGMVKEYLKAVNMPPPVMP